jgi:5-methylcytosine-specific restriction endonuclease McrA
MPIRKEFRRFFRSPEWQAIKARIRERAGGRCERCKAIDGRWIFTVWDGTGRWWPPGQEPEDLGAKLHYVEVVLTVSHLNHDPHDNRDENVAALCRGCHLRHDTRLHHNTARRTRARKAGQRWLNEDLEQAAYPWVAPGGRTA